LLLVSACIWPAATAVAHDPSSWGGLYRTRDGGATWFLSNEGRFVTTALDLAIDATDSSRLLLATESGLLRSINGGRDWDVDRSEALRGAVFAVAVAPDGSRAIASTSTTIVVTDPARSGDWRAVPAPPGAAPARQIVAGARTGQVYVVGWSGLVQSDDWGESWQSLGEGLPSPIVTRLVALPTTSSGASGLLALCGGALWISDGGQTWEHRESGLPRQGVDTVVADGLVTGRLWAAGADRVFRSNDAGTTWQPVGGPLDEQHTPIHSIGASPNGRALVLTTDRGLYRSGDGGTTWELLADGVPVHLPARPLARDPRDGATFYAGFSIRPYDALWEAAAEGTSALQRLDAVNVGGAAALLALVLLAGGVALGRLRRYYQAPAAATASMECPAPDAGQASSIRSPRSLDELAR
jgi:photosystem II stability/assembly factor-like uncharacterized protein